MNVLWNFFACLTYLGGAAAGRYKFALSRILLTGRAVCSIFFCVRAHYGYDWMRALYLVSRVYGPPGAAALNGDAGRATGVIVVSASVVLPHP